jgi:hypothetical protein
MQALFGGFLWEGASARGGQPCHAGEWADGGTGAGAGAGLGRWWKLEMVYVKIRLMVVLGQRANDSELSSPQATSHQVATRRAAAAHSLQAFLIALALGCLAAALPTTCYHVRTMYAPCT